MPAIAIFNYRKEKYREIWCLKMFNQIIIIPINATAEFIRVESRHPVLLLILKSQEWNSLYIFLWKFSRISQTLNNNVQVTSLLRIIIIF